jgi:hypothetical protein
MILLHGAVLSYITQVRSLPPFTATGFLRVPRRIAQPCMNGSNCSNDTEDFASGEIEEATDGIDWNFINHFFG